MLQLAYIALVSGFLLLSQVGAAASESDALIIEETYDSWERATNAKDIGLWSSYLAPGAVFIPPGVPPLMTEEDILDYYRAAFADPHFALDCRQQAVEFAESGEMAWARGVCHAAFTDPGGQKAEGISRWFKIWLKQPDGSWKCKVNTWNFEGG
jgi:ketosteroid isomerase-like protein